MPDTNFKVLLIEAERKAYAEGRGEDAKFLAAVLDYVCDYEDVANARDAALERARDAKEDLRLFALAVRAALDDVG